MDVPCGKCMACRINHSRDWSLRAMHELDAWDKACFITLTYDDKHLFSYEGSRFATLVQQHLVTFIKRLRRKLEPRKIKYYACGEYGENNTRRPHYHLIVYGLGVDECCIDRKTGQSKAGVLLPCWSDENGVMGLIHVGTATWDSIRYVGQYIEKKYLGNQAKKVYGEIMRIEAPFQMSSNGFGLGFALENRAQLQQNLCTTLKGKKRKLPRYYVKKLKLDTSANLEKIDKKKLDKLKTLDEKGIRNYSQVSKKLHEEFRQREANVKGRINISTRRDKIK